MRLAVAGSLSILGGLFALSIHFRLVKLWFSPAGSYRRSSYFLLVGGGGLAALAISAVLAVAFFSVAEGPMLSAVSGPMPLIRPPDEAQTRTRILPGPACPRSIAMNTSGVFAIPSWTVSW